MLVRFVCKEGGSTGPFTRYALITYQKSRWPLKYRNDRHGANITVLIQMRDFAKLKILEVSAISWQYFGWSLAYLQLVLGVNECNWSWNDRCCVIYIYI